MSAVRINVILLDVADRSVRFEAICPAIIAAKLEFPDLLCALFGEQIGARTTRVGIKSLKPAREGSSSFAFHSLANFGRESDINQNVDTVTSLFDSTENTNSNSPVEYWGRTDLKTGHGVIRPRDRRDDILMVAHRCLLFLLGVRAPRVWILFVRRGTRILQQSGIGKTMTLSLQRSTV